MQSSLDTDVLAPCNREGHSCVQVNNKVYLFGGEVNATKEMSSELLQVDITVNRNKIQSKWSSIAAAGGEKDSSTTIEDNNLTEYENMGDDGVSKSLEWPQARKYHSATMISQTQFLIFGGVNRNGECLNDTWVFDCTTSQWTEIKLKDESSPSPRSFSKISSIFNPVTESVNVVLMGGYSGGTNAERLGDTYMLDISSSSSSQWAMVEVGNEMNKPSSTV